MIQMLTAYTTEVDEVEDGISELLTQIDLGKLKKNSIGLVTCHYDFIETGFIAELHKKTGFDIIGMTTLASSNTNGISMYSLSLTVLTSDDVEFKTGSSKSLDLHNYNENIETLYKEIRGASDSDPSMIIAFFPYLRTLNGPIMLRALDDACNGIPIWGSLATNIDVSYERCQAFRNGKNSEDNLVILLLTGEVNPEFISVSIPDQNIGAGHGMITESEGCILKKINGIPALKYLENMGVTIIESAATVTPLMVYYEGNNTPVALGIYTVLDDGGLLCGGEMPTGSTLTIGEITPQGILSTTAEGITRLLNTGKKNGVLMLPCVTRYVMLAPKQNSELELISEKLKDQLPFMVGYSGGEVCPIQDNKGKHYNRFHNYTFSACIF